MKAKMMYMFGLLAAFTLTACSDNESEPSIVTVESISISPLSISLERDKTYQLQAEVTPKEATEKKVSWSSSDTQVATVSENTEVQIRKYIQNQKRKRGEVSGKGL